MAAKRKQSQTTHRRGSSASRGMAWFLTGAVVGGLGTWTVLGRDPAAEHVRATVERTVGHSIGVDSTAPPPKPKFEFYTLLPEMEVVVPDEDLPAPRSAPAGSDTTDESGTTAEGDTTDEKSSPTDAESSTDTTVQAKTRSDSHEPLKSGHYILQVASFRNMKEADGLKAQLTLLGFRPVVQSVAINSDENWYRVRIGPYADRDSLEAARVRLRADGHGNPLVVWVKKG